MIKLLAIRKIKTEKTVIKESNSARQPPTGEIVYSFVFLQSNKNKSLSCKTFSKSWENFFAKSQIAVS